MRMLLFLKDFHIISFNQKVRIICTYQNLKTHIQKNTPVKIDLKQAIKLSVKREIFYEK